MKKAVVCIFFVPPLLLVASAGGPLHPLGDSLAVFRLYLGVIALICGAGLFVLNWRRSGIGAMVLSVAAIGAILWSYHGPQPQGDFPYTHYQKNLLYVLYDPAEIIADIQEQDPDFITLQEMTPRSNGLMVALQEDYPTQSVCLGEDDRGIALASRFDMVPESRICMPGHGMLAVQVITPDGPVWLVTLHLRWPFPLEQAEQVTRILPVLEGLTGPVVLGGDFNMVPWSDTMTRIETATRTRRVGRTIDTFLVEGHLMVPIDHVLAPQGCKGRVSALDLLGSDHHGVLAHYPIGACS
ncbi:endonuclease/exonuclease/phosphatase family protein [Neptunicoccus sediminis]|uniref:endonuclease/exonuclease/phosphatase family protein n=1 Tax=Neptunicoccus sediminis TaxID=1892596 RepID=UPI0012FF7BD7|nr:endonuclease/exonuclease/phosphatase family protein [Neptunicoccus sediminis]